MDWEWQSDRVHFCDFFIEMGLVVKLGVVCDLRGLCRVVSLWNDAFGGWVEDLLEKLPVNERGIV